VRSKLLQLLQDGPVLPDRRPEDKGRGAVVCAHQPEPEAEIEAGTFRQDLYYRINVVNIRMPALRERRGDIENWPLISRILNRKFNCKARPLSSGKTPGWCCGISLAGNIRELGESHQALT